MSTSQEKPFLVGGLAISSGTIGWRAAVLWAASQDEALGRFLRERAEEDPNTRIEVPEAKPLSFDFTARFVVGDETT